MAHQVDDHHVLGAVLGRALKLSALPGGLPPVRGPLVRALDRPGHHGPARPAQEQLGRQAGHGAADMRMKAAYGGRRTPTAWQNTSSGSPSKLGSSRRQIFAWNMSPRQM